MTSGDYLKKKDGEIKQFKTGTEYAYRLRIKIT